MDYKVVRLAAAVFAALLILIGVIVYAQNADRIRAGKGGSSSDAEESIEAETDISSTDGIGMGEQIGSNLKGFMSDKDFFDEPENISGVYSEDVTGVSLYPKGGEGNIEIAVKNDRGGLETGTVFEVLLKEAGDDPAEGTVYKDTDRDGRILIEELPEGEYIVSLRPREGYHVPVSGSLVRVSKPGEAGTAASAGSSDTEPKPSAEEGEGGYTPVDFALPGIDYPVDGNIITPVDGNIIAPVEGETVTPVPVQGNDILPSNAAEAISSDAGVKLGNDDGVDDSASSMTPGPLN